MGTDEPTDTALAEYDDPEDKVLAMRGSQVAALAKSEVESQLDAAHRYPRSLKKFLDNATSMATINRETAESCIYALPRGGKTISGPSVRLAEICASAWGNLHLAARIVGEEETNVIAQGGAWDLERNVRFSVETKRKITDRNGKRYNEDMIIMTGNAAASIALRNAIFRVIPKAFVGQVYDRCRKVAVGDASTLAQRRDEVLGRLAKMGADKDRVLAAVQKASVEDIGLSELEQLIGMGTSVKEGRVSVDEAFPAPQMPNAPTQEGRRMPLGAKPVEPAKTDALKKGKEEKPAEREPGSDG